MRFLIIVSARCTRSRAADIELEAHLPTREEKHEARHDDDRDEHEDDDGGKAHS